MAYYSYEWQRDFEQDYTILHWNQRGCGNTYYRNQEAESPTLHLLLSDLDELVEHIRLAYDKEKVIMMGHSWGPFSVEFTGENTRKRYPPISQSAKCWIL